MFQPTLAAVRTNPAPRANGRNFLPVGRSGSLTRDRTRLLDTALPEFERVLIRTALARSGGRRQDAAKLLGWGRNTLTRKMRELSMDE